MSPRFLFALTGICSLCLLRLASAQDRNPAANNPAFTNWPLPSPAPAGTNTALYPMPRNEWMTQFARNVDHIKGSRVDLVFDGDSITDGWQGNGKAVWARNYGDHHATNFGIGGDRTEQLLWRLDHGQVDGLQPKLIALMIGTNNLWSNTDEQIAAAIGAIVAEYRRLCPGAVILLQGIFPRGEKPTDANRQRIKSVNAAITKLGDGKQVVYVDFGDKFLEPDGTMSREVMPDFLHPSAKGYEIWADAIRDEVEKVLGPLPAGAGGL